MNAPPKMRIQVRYFASLREALGASESVELAAGATLGTLRDDKASGATIAPGPAASFQSVDGGNLTNWFVNAVIGNGGAPVPAPALDRLAALLLAALLAGLAWRRSRAAARR